MLPKIKESNKYIDLCVNDEFYEIKTILTCIAFNNNPEFKEKIIKAVIETIEKTRKNYIESMSRYIIFNMILYHYNATQYPKTEFEFLFNEAARVKHHKWASSDNILGIRTQDLFVYDMKKKEIVYINEDSLLFKPVLWDMNTLKTIEGDKKKGYSINIESKFTEKELCEAINGK